MLETQELVSDEISPFKIQRTCVYDGPGIRTTLFFRGCNLRCLWCQNPEMQSFKSDVPPEQDYTFNEIIDTILRDKVYYQSTTGGVTLSGGEPFLQDPRRLIPLLERLKKEGIRVTAETSLHAPWDHLAQIAPYIDLFLVDFKIVGDETLHKKYTKQESALIQDNLKKLLELGANIEFRMVMVPGYTDDERNIQATAELLKSIGYDTIELLKYHNFYEEKAQRLGLDPILLKITNEQSTAAVENGIKLFEKNGITAEYAELQTPTHHAKFTSRVKAIQRALRGAPRALCIESAKIKTKFYKKHGFKKPVAIHRAERLAYVLQNKTVKVYPRELLVGNFTAKRVAGHLWEEYFGALPYIFFLFNINRQKPVSFKISLKDQLYFYQHIMLYWWKYSLIGRVYHTLALINLGMARTSEMVVGFNNNMASIAHFIVNFDRLLTLGTTGLKAEVQAAREAHPENNQTFYEGALIALEGLEVFAGRYADEVTKMSLEEKDPERKKELEEMAVICRYVPKNPARTFHEALQSMLFLHVALCQESYENAISFGRLDQILYPYYKQDVDAGRITYEKAKELLCLFILKMDECIFVNDGNSILSLNKMFETISTDQALTFGGVDKDGKDATNDLTYMLLDACELQTLSLDMGARIHKNSPDKYLERLAELYINGCPLPQLFSDDIYIPSIMKHYPTTLEHARNYAIVGCVEPNASDEHFGNTDCANVNLALPLLQAMKGQTRDLWNITFGEQVEKLVTNLVEFALKGKNRFSRFILRAYYASVRRLHRKRGLFKYAPPKSFEELLARFQTRLNILTRSILKDHQYIEKVLRTYYTTPLASTLFKSCVQRGMDAYEGGVTLNSSGIQAVGVTDVADSLHALEEVVFKKKLYTLRDVIRAMDANFEGTKGQEIREALLSVPKFGDDTSSKPAEWVTEVMRRWNDALDSVPNCTRNGRYSAGYYALNVCNRYGRKTPALPSGRLYGIPLANSVTPHYGMEQADLLSSLNAISEVNFTDHAENGTTVTFSIDSGLFQGQEGVKKLAGIFKTFLTTGGMQLQPNVINREILLDAYDHPEKYPNLLVRIAGYCAYFNELSDEMKLSVINRTYYT